MPRRIRSVALAAHIALSVGWVGALAAYLALDVVAATSRDEPMLRAAYLGMELTAVSVIVPLALASLASGLVMAVGTQWGLLRHYWVLLSLALTVVAVVVLLAQLPTIGRFAEIAADPATSAGELRALRTTLVHSIGGLAVLLVVLVLNVAKPRGMTRYGWRKQRQRPAPASS